MSVTNFRRRSVAALVSTLALSIAAAGCGSDSASAPGSESVTPSIEMIDRTNQALGTGVLEWVNGTYANCTTRTGNWSARILGLETMTNAPLTVIKNDTNCDLTVTQLAAGAVLYTADPSIPFTVGNTYAASGSAFANGLGPVLFFANAKIDSILYAANFTLTVVFSDDLAETNPQVSATYATVTSASNSEFQVPAPEYTVSFDELVLQTNVSQVVQTATGTMNLDLVALGQTGEFYVVSNTVVTGTFEDVDVAYEAGDPIAIATPFDVDDLDLGGTTLPQERDVIILHEDNGVRSYELIRITFTVATS